MQAADEFSLERARRLAVTGYDLEKKEKRKIRVVCGIVQ